MKLLLVPIEDVEALEAIEDAEDIFEAELALKEIEKRGSIPVAEVIRRLKNKERGRKGQAHPNEENSQLM